MIRQIWQFAIAILVTCATSQAALIVSESFNDKSVGDLNGQAGGNDLGTPTGTWNTPWLANPALNVVNVDLNYSNGSVFLAGGNRAIEISSPVGTIDGAYERTFTQQTGTVYFSFLFRPGQAVDSGTAGDFVQLLLNSNLNDANSGSIGLNRTTTGNPFFARINDNTNNTSVNSTIDGNTTPEQTWFLVGKFSDTNNNGIHNRMDLWVNPTSDIEGSNAIAATASREAANNGVVDRLTLRVSALEGDIYYLDEFRVGTTFSDVVPIPEPGVLLWHAVVIFCLSLKCRSWWR